MAKIPSVCSCGERVPFHRSLWQCPGCSRYICGACKKGMEHVDSAATVVLNNSVPYVLAASGHPELAAMSKVVTGPRWVGDIVCPGSSGKGCGAVVSGANRLKLGPL